MTECPCKYSALADPKSNIRLLCVKYADEEEESGRVRTALDGLDTDGPALFYHLRVLNDGVRPEAVLGNIP